MLYVKCCLLQERSLMCLFQMTATSHQFPSSPRSNQKIQGVYDKSMYYKAWTRVLREDVLDYIIGPRQKAQGQSELSKSTEQVFLGFHRMQVTLRLRHHLPSKLIKRMFALHVALLHVSLFADNFNRPHYIRKKVCHSQVFKPSLIHTLVIFYH